MDLKGNYDKNDLDKYFNDSITFSMLCESSNDIRKSKLYESIGGKKKVEKCVISTDKLTLNESIDLSKSHRSNVRKQLGKTKSHCTSLKKSNPSCDDTQNSNDKTYYEDSTELKNWGLPLTILNKYESRGVKNMFPWQVECLKNENVLEKGKNLIYSAPTSAGKTLVSEILLIKTVLERKKKVLFVLPFVSVVREKMYYFQDLLADSGIKVEGFMGGIQPPGGFSNTDIAISTIEKGNSLINQLMEDGNLENLGAVIIDELHLLGDSHRGYLLELLLTKLSYMNLKEEHINIQLIGMSATLPNLNLLADWLNAEIYKTDFRPVPLKELCQVGSTIYDNKFNIIKELKPLPYLSCDNENILQLCLETVCDGYSVLIFCPNKKWCQELAITISKTFFELGNNNNTEISLTLRKQLNRDGIIEVLEQLKRTPIGLDQILCQTVSFGIGFHHAGLTMDERDIIEGAFRTGVIKVLTATSTLSNGVNLPARRVIIRTPNFHGKLIDTLTYKQMIGRAGRMGKDTAGESILVCKKNEMNSAKKVMNSELNPVKSCLEDFHLLIRALLEIIASEVAYTSEEIFTYAKCTLMSFSISNGSDKVEKLTKDAIEFLLQNELLLLQISEEENKRRWVATQLGKACLAASLPPKDGLFLFDEVRKARDNFILSTELHLIYVITPFNCGNQLNEIDWFNYFSIWDRLPKDEKRVGEIIGVSEKFLVKASEGYIRPGKLLDIHRRFYVALALYDLVREHSLQTISNKYIICRGFIQNLQQTASTFAGMVTQFCKRLEWNCIEILVSQFQTRLHFGVCRELLDLLRLTMLNGLRARSLYKEGIKTVADLAKANEFDVERALYKATPFDSVKEKDEEQKFDTEKRNKMKIIFITGMDGITLKEAAVMIVKEARSLVQNEIGLEDIKWDENNRLKIKSQVKPSNSSLSISTPTPSNKPSKEIKSTFLTIHSFDEDCGGNQKTDERNSPKNEVDDVADVNKAVADVTNVVECVNNVVVDDDDEDDDIFSMDESKNDNVLRNNLSKNEFKKDLTIDESSKHINDENDVNFSTEITTPALESIGKIRAPSFSKSLSQSPILFEDSMNLDVQEFTDGLETQDTDILEQNIDPDNINFDDTYLSPEKLSKLSANIRNVSSKSIESSLNVSVDLINENLSQKQMEIISMADSIVWNDTVWTNQPDLKINKSNLSIKSEIEINKNATEENLQSPIAKVRKMSRSSIRKTPLHSLENIKPSVANKSKIQLSFLKDLNDLSFNTLEYSDFDGHLSSNLDGTKENVKSKNLTLGKSIRSLRSSTRIHKSASRIDILRNVSDSEKSLNASSSRKKSSRKCSSKNLNDKSTPEYSTNDYESSFSFSSSFSSPFSPNISIKNSPDIFKNRLESLIVNVSNDKRIFNDFKKSIEEREEISISLASEVLDSFDDNYKIGTKLIGRNNSKKNPIDSNKIINNNKFYGMGISWGKKIYYISFENTNSDDDDDKVTISDRMSLMSDILSSSKLTLRCFNLKEIYKTLYKCCGLIPTCKFLDCSMAQWLLNPDLNVKSFENLINEHYPEGLNLLKNSTSFTDRKCKVNACSESLLNWYLIDIIMMKLKMKNVKLIKTLKEVEMNTLSIITRMELNGLGVNLSALQELSNVILQEQKELKEKIFMLAGKQFNILSSKSVAEVLGLAKRRTNKNILEKLDNPMSNLIISWRKLDSVYTKIVCPMLNLAEKSNRIFSNSDMYTITGRIVMFEPSLQNVPRDFNSADDKFVISVRMAFIPLNGNVFVSADYCQLELRILAHFSKESVLCEVLKKPGDVFKNIAARWYNTSESEIDDDMRQRTKQLCYGMIYGMGVKSLAETLNVDEKQAQVFTDTFMNTYPGIKKWLEKVVEKAKKNGYVSTIMKRQRTLTGINSDIISEKNRSERQAVNTIIQGSAADITKKAMVLIDERIKTEFPNTPLIISNKSKINNSCSSNSSNGNGHHGAHLVLQLHDELMYEVDGSNLNKFVNIIKECMEENHNLCVPLPVKVKTGSAWGDLTEYNFND